MYAKAAFPGRHSGTCTRKPRRPPPLASPPLRAHKEPHRGGRLRNRHRRYPTSPLGDRLFRSSFNQINPSPYPLPVPPIRRVWIGRGRTSFSPNHIKRRARASKSAVLLPPSLLLFLFFLLPLGVLQGWQKTINCVFFIFLLFPLPAIAENRSYLQNKHICGHSPDENNFA